MTITADELRTVWSLILHRQPEDAKALAALLGSREEALAYLVVTEKAFDNAPATSRALARGARGAAAPTMVRRRREFLAVTPKGNQTVAWRMWQIVTSSTGLTDLANQLVEATQESDIPDIPDDWRFLPERR
jgi:hypothetical protein